MAAAIKDELGLDAVLIKGDRGIFDVVADGELIYSKYETGAFPDAAEVLAPLRARLKG
ncbi:MAG: Rdx family protein [Planctomycetota bacterium]